MEEDEQGDRTLTVSEATTERRLFYSGSTTTLTAICRARVTPNPTPLYGRAPASAVDPTGST